MQLSIIIVSYNVRYFLEQCLLSVQKAMIGLDAELIVVDNGSADGTVDFLKPLFPGVCFIANETNTGFAKANNLAVRQCRGEYVLFLNPDTLLPEDCLQRCLHFISSHPLAGAMGTRMLDGKGRFLPESKRAFPSLKSSFFKLTGLAKLFPRSALFNAYALGDLDPKQDHSIEVLAGAFVLARKEVLNTLGGFDESFFLYGEDIDLSYRIRKAGYQNLYFAGAPIIHFKGESSATAQFDRVKYFYQAMLVFVQKHYRTGAAKSFSWLIRVAIFLRAIFSFAARLLKPTLLPLIDFALVCVALHAVRVFWINQFRRGTDFHVPAISWLLPVFALVFVLAGALAGLYDKLYKTSRSLVALVFGFIAVLAVYALLPETLRFSRAVVVCGGALGVLMATRFRQSLFLRITSWMGYENELAGPTVVVGNEKEYGAVVSLLNKAMLADTPPLRVSPNELQPDAIGTMDELETICSEYAVGEIVFCEGELSLSEIINQLSRFTTSRPHFLFHLAGSHSLVGSDQPAQRGRNITAYADYRLAYPYQRRMKRMADIATALIFLLAAPLHLLLHPRPIALLRQSWRVLRGYKTWVGYRSSENTLPALRPGIATPPARTDAFYAKNYDWWQDLRIILHAYRRLA